MSTEFNDIESQRERSSKARSRTEKKQAKSQKRRGSTTVEDEKKRRLNYRFLLALLHVLARRIGVFIIAAFAWLLNRLGPACFTALQIANTLLEKFSLYVVNLTGNGNGHGNKQRVRSIRRVASMSAIAVVLLWLFIMYKQATSMLAHQVVPVHNSINEAHDSHITSLNLGQGLEDEEGEDDNDEEIGSEEYREDGTDHSIENSDTATKKSNSDGLKFNSKKARKVRAKRPSKPAILHTPVVERLRQEKLFYVVPLHAKRKSKRHVASQKSVIQSGLEQLGYRESTSPSAMGVSWIVAYGLDCANAEVNAALNSIADLSQVVVFCTGDINTVSHVGRKDVQDQRMRWLDTNLHRHSDCILYDDFVPLTFTVNPGTDLKALEAAIAREGLSKTSNFILKSQIAEKSSSLPLITDSALLDLKKLQHQRSFDGIMMQRLVEKPLLWLGRKFSIRTWAVVLRMDPLLVLYRDGMIRRSLEDFHRPRKSKARYASITTAQAHHPEYKHRASESFACMDEFQEFLSGSLTSAEIAHYVNLILKPYMKRIMLFAIASIRRETTRRAEMNVIQHLCFDFGIDSNWNVWFYHMDANCAASAGGSEYASSCKSGVDTAVGTEVVGIAEQMLQTGVFADEKQSSTGLGFGSFELLVDDASQRSSADHQGERDGGFMSRIRPVLCQRSLYQSFRSRQTFNRRVIQELLPQDGHPSTLDIPALDVDETNGLAYPYTMRGEETRSWRCPHCGYANQIGSNYCDMCGSKHEEPAAVHLRGQVGHHESAELEQDEEVIAHIPISERLDQWHSQQAALSGTPSRTRKREANPGSVLPLAVDEQSCFGTKFHIMRNSDITGHDIEPLRAVDLLQCCEACAAHHGCTGFTFIQVDLQCWLKSDSKPLGYRPGASSGERSVGARAADGRSVEDRPSRFQENTGWTGESLFGEEHTAPEARSRGEQIPFGGVSRLSSSQDVKAAYYRKQLEELFQEHDPSQLRRVDSLLRRYRGNEERLLHKTRQQYALLDQVSRSKGQVRQGSIDSLVSPHREHSKSVDQHGLSSADYRARLVELLLQYDPKEVANVDNLMSMFAGQEMELLRTLMDKYHD